MTPHLPQHWTVGAPAIREAFARLAAIAPEAATGARPLPYLPAYYDDTCRRRFIALRLHHPDLLWRHVEPMFALAAASLEFQHRVGTDAALAAFATHYEMMRGASPLAWRHARALFEDAWSALGRL